ncbi:MAG TPA: diacylglycerol kinase family protein [Ktedonobacteraceae bacterium]
MLNARKILLVHSPHSGRSSQLDATIASLRTHSLELVEVLSIAELDGLPDQGPQWKERGIDIVVAAGGDGLIGGVTTHIVASGLPLAILPLGTSNDIARSLNIPQEVSAALELLTNGQIIAVDVGIAQPAEQAPHAASSQPGIPTSSEVRKKHHGSFVHALTTGINVQFARIATNVATRQRYGRMTYPFAAIEILRNHATLEMDIQFTDLAIPSTTDPTQPPVVSKQSATLHCQALQATIINAPIFGGAWNFSVPQATLYDGLLDIIIIEDIDINALNTTLSHFFSRSEQRPSAPQAWHERYPELHPAELTGIPGIHHVQARGVTITTSVDPQDVTLDGEIRGQTPISVRMASERLRVVVPG